MGNVDAYLTKLVVEATTGQEVMTELDHLVGQVAFGYIGEGKYQASLHDAFVKNFSQRRAGNEYRISMDFDAFVYVDGKEHGKRRINFTFNTKVNLRHLSNREIYGIAMMQLDGEMGFAYWQPRRKHQLPSDTWYMAKLVKTAFKYTNLVKTMGPVVPYNSES